MFDDDLFLTLRDLAEDSDIQTEDGGGTIVIKCIITLSHHILYLPFLSTTEILLSGSESLSSLL